MRAVILVKLKPAGLTATLDAVKRIKGVVKAVFTFGRYDLAALVEAPTVGDVCRIALKINELPNIVSTETLIEFQP